MSLYPMIKVALDSGIGGYVIASIPPEDAYHTGTLLVVGMVRRIDGDREAEAWKAWLFPAAGGWAHITQSCEAVEAGTCRKLRDRLEKRARRGAWWK